MTGSTPQVSVCLPVFNGEMYLREAVESVLSQTFRDFELLISDDCSADRSWEIVQEYAARDSRIRCWRNEENLRLFGNYNSCLTTAHGTYIKPFAQDDVLEADALARMVKVLDDNSNVSLVTCETNWIDSSGHDLEKLQRFNQDQLLSSKEVIRANLIVLRNWIGEPAAVMFRGSSKGAGFDTSLYHWGDIDYWFRILQDGDLFVISQRLANFRMHSGSTTTANLSGMYYVADIVRIYEKWKSYLDELGETEKQFFARVSEEVALQVDHLERNQSLSSARVRAAGLNPDQSFSSAQVSDFRVALYQTESRLSSLMKELIASQNELEHRVNECFELKAAIQVMENSVSWKLTRPLRIVREWMKDSK